MPIGPLYDGAIVNGAILGPMVRATALSASRALLEQPPGPFQGFCGTREDFIQTLLSKHSHMTSFEAYHEGILASRRPRPDLTISTPVGLAPRSGGVAPRSGSLSHRRRRGTPSPVRLSTVVGAVFPSSQG